MQEKELSHYQGKCPDCRDAVVTVYRCIDTMYRCHSCCGRVLNERQESCFGNINFN